MKKIILIGLFFLAGMRTHAQEEIFVALENYDTTFVKNYLANGGDIDILKNEKIGSSSLKVKRIKLTANLFEIAVVQINKSEDENNPNTRIKAYRNLYLLLAHIHRSKNKKELLNKVFTLSISVGDVDLVRHIYQMGADVNTRCVLCYGRSALLIALGYNQNFELIKFILSLKPDLTATDYDGKNALHYAAQNGNLEMIKYFLDNKLLDINARDKSGKTPLMYAANLGDYETFNYLCSKGADYTLSAKKGLNVLHCAASTGDVEFFRHVHYVTKLPLWYKGLRKRDVFQQTDVLEGKDEPIQLYITRYTIKHFGARYYKKRKRRLILKHLFA